MINNQQITTHNHNSAVTMPLQMTSNRLDWLDWAKTICMFCVILTHTHCFGGMRLLNYFHIPAFMLISGFLYKPVPIKEELVKLFRGIVIPYLLINLTNMDCFFVYLFVSMDGFF